MKQKISWILVLFLSLFGAEIYAQNIIAPKVKALKLGQSINYMSMRNVDGTQFELNKLPANTKGMIVIFMSNTCDHCIMYRQRIKDLNAKYKKMGFPLVAVSPLGGMPEKWPLDAFPAMKETAKTEKFDFPYLSDDRLFYTYLFDVMQTPTALVFKREGNTMNYTLVYRGKIDNNERNANLATQKFVEKAVNSALKVQ